MISSKVAAPASAKNLAASLLVSATCSLKYCTWSGEIGAPSSDWKSFFRDRHEAAAMASVPVLDKATRKALRKFNRIQRMDAEPPSEEVLKILCARFKVERTVFDGWRPSTLSAILTRAAVQRDDRAAIIRRLRA